MQLVGQRERVKHLHGIGADVDAGAELCEFGCLLENLYLEALMAKRNGCYQSPESSPYDSNPTRACHAVPLDAMTLRSLPRWSRPASAVMGRLPRNTLPAPHPASRAERGCTRGAPADRYPIVERPATGQLFAIALIATVRSPVSLSGRCFARLALTQSRPMISCTPAGGDGGTSRIGRFG